MHDSGESLDVSICYTISNMTSPSISQSHDLSVCQPKTDPVEKPLLTIGLISSCPDQFSSCALY